MALGLKPGKYLCFGNYTCSTCSQVTGIAPPTTAHLVGDRGRPGGGCLGLYYMTEADFESKMHQIATDLGLLRRRSKAHENETS